MDRAAKESLVQEYHNIFVDAGIVVISHYKGLTMPQMDMLRHEMKTQGGRFRVVKNRLVRRALTKTAAEPLSDLFEGPTALAWSQDPITAPKILAKFAKDYDVLVLRGGLMGETVLDAQAVQALASLPSLDEVRGQLVGLLLAPAQKLLRLMQEPGAQIARLVQQKPASEAAASQPAPAATPAAGDATDATDAAKSSEQSSATPDDVKNESSESTTTQTT